MESNEQISEQLNNAMDTDNFEKVDILEEKNNQDIYIPTFYSPPISTLPIGEKSTGESDNLHLHTSITLQHAEDKGEEYAKTESINGVNEAQVCVDILRSESLDSEPKVIGDTGRRCDVDIRDISSIDDLNMSKNHFIAEREMPVAMKESMEGSNERSLMGSSYQFSSPHIKNKSQSAFPRQTDQIHGEPTASGETFDTIRVRLKQPLTQDTLKYYFENTRKSGGGDIESLTIVKGTEMEVEEVLITFAESKYATNCLQQVHILCKIPLDAQKYDKNDQSLWEMDKALVTGLNPVTIEDTLMNFLEPAAGVDLIKLVRGVQEDAAMVVFAEKPDFAKISKRCKEKTLEGNTLFVQMVKKCQTIYVKGIDKGISYDLVENFFCNKRRSGGGDIEKVDYHPEDGYCIVYFENPSDASNVAEKGKFTISGREIQAQTYFPCLGLPEEAMNWDDMPYVSYESNIYLIKFVKNCVAECSHIEKALQKKFVKIEWPILRSDFIVRLQCTVTKDVKNAKKILKRWREEALAEMDTHMKRYVCQKHSILPEAWPTFLAQLKKLNTDHPDRVAIILEMKNHAVIVAGYEENSEALTRIILDLIKTEESKIQIQTEKIIKNIPLDFHKCQKLWKTHIGMKLMSDFPDLDFQVEINKKEVTLTGKPTEVNEALISMHEYLMKTKSKSLNISKGRYEIFMEKEVKESFIAEMKAKGNKAVWNVTEDKIEMTSSNSRMVDEALEIFQEFIPEKRIQMKNLVKVLTMHDWQACVKDLRDKHDEKLNVSSSSSEVCVTATRDIFENVYKQIEHVLKSCSKKCCIDRKVVNLSQQQFSYIKYFGQNKIGQIANASTSKELEIKQNQSDCSIEITGNDEDVKKAYDNLMRFIKRLREESCSLNKPEAKVFFNSSKGREAMKKAGKETSCIISNKEGLWHIKENRESGYRRTPYSLPIKIAEYAIYDDVDDTSRERTQYQRHHSGNRGSMGWMLQPVEENVTLLILSNTDENIRKAKKSLNEMYKCSDIDAPEQKWNDRQGPSNEVNEATVDIPKYLHEVKYKEKARAIQMYVKWQYEASPDKWMTFRDEINMEIETAYKEQKNTGSCVVRDRTGTEYVIDFGKMEEYEKSNYRKKYKIRRMDKAGGISVGLPVKWAHMKSDQTLVEIKLSPHDREYKDVLARFNATSGGSVSISEIRRVQNPSLYQQYAAKRKEISIRNKKDPEQWLWHGTYPETVDKIINNGFNRSYCGKHGNLCWTSCGAGMYFAVNASYSLGYCRADSRGHKHMFSVQVATGDVCQGSGGMFVLPLKPGAGGHVTYDSASDNPSNPVMFVIFNDSQAYPAYHILFR